MLFQVFGQYLNYITKQTFQLFYFWYKVGVNDCLTKFFMSGRVGEMHCDIWMFSPPGLDIVII